MIDNFQGDPAILITKNGATLVFNGGQPAMDQGFENQALIALFTEKGWPGNYLFDNPDQQIGGDFEKLARGPITLSKLSLIEKTAEKQLASQYFGNVTAVATNPESWRTDVVITIEPPGADKSTILLSSNGQNWISQAENPAHKTSSNIPGTVIYKWPPWMGKTNSIPNTEFATPLAFADGLTYTGLNLISGDDSGAVGTVFEHDGVTAALLQTLPLSFASLSGLTFDGTNLMSADHGLPTLINIHDGISAAILSSFAAPASDPSGLTFDGTNLISCDIVTGLIYIHDGISAAILSSFAAPASDPNDLTFDGDNLISTDRTTGLIYIHDGISAAILSSFAAPASDPSGLTFDGTNLISCDAVTNMVYVHPGVAVYAGP